MVNMKNLKRKAAIAKYKQLHRGQQAIIELLPTLRTGFIVNMLREMGYIYKGHKWVKKYAVEKQFSQLELAKVA